jgi:hypothetical protein
MDTLAPDPRHAVSPGSRKHRPAGPDPVRLLIAAVFWLVSGVGLAADFNCVAGDVACLIDAINTANGTAASDTIHLAAGTYTLTAVDNDTDGPNGLPSITSDITVVGAGATTTIIQRDPLLGGSSPLFRVFHVAGSGTLTLEALTITGGFLHDDGDDGPGIFNAGGVLHITHSIVTDNTGIEFSLGGGVFNDTGGTLTVANSSISDNTSNADGGVAGIYNRGTADITETTIDHNLSFTGSTGGIRNTGTMTLINSSVIRSFADVTGTAGIVNQDGGTLTLKNCTVADNNLTFQFPGVGGIRNVSGTVSLLNTILATNTSLVDDGMGGLDQVFSNCAGTLTSLGNNLIGVSTVENACAINAVGSDITGIDEGVLDAFADDGTPGNGHFPLVADSPAIDAGNAANPGSGGDACEATDQLGTPRPIDGNCDGIAVCDIGAIEFVPAVDNVDAKLTGVPDPSSFAFDPTPVPEGPAGTFSFTAEFCNAGIQNLTCLRSVTTTLTGGNALINRNGATPPGVGSELSFQLTQGFADGILAPGECVDVFYQIGLAAKASFQFVVSVVGATN